MSLNCKFYGGSTGSIFSKVWGRNINITETDFDNYNIGTYIPSWDNDTYMLCKFINNIEGGSITSVIGYIESLLLYRQLQGDNNLELSSLLTTNAVEFIDFNVINNEVYTYYLFAKGSDSISSPITTDAIQSDYYGWFLIDTELNKSYQLDINFSGGNKLYVENFTEYETNNTNKIFTRGENFYLDISLSGIFSKNNLKEDIKFTNGDLSSFSEFVNSVRPKLLKSRRGEIYKVIVTEYKESLLNSALAENIYVANIKIKEVGDV